MSSASLPLPRLFVQHVTKTAGTSLLSYLEPNVASSRMHSSQEFWRHWSSESPESLPHQAHSPQPILICTPPARVESLCYAHGHYTELFRRALFNDWFCIGTCRNVDDRVISILHHHERDPRQDSRVVAYLQGELHSKTEVMRSLFQNSQIFYYSRLQPRFSDWENSDTVREDLDRSAQEAAANLTDYDCIIDTADFDAHCERLASFLPYSRNLGRLNTQADFGAPPVYSRKHVEILRADFPHFFEREDQLYAKLRERSAATLAEPLEQALNRQQQRSLHTVAVFPDQADISSMSIALPAELPGWKGEFFRILRPGAALHGLPVIPGVYRGYLWLWCGDPQRYAELEINLPGVENLRCESLLIESPARHLWLMEIQFENSLAQDLCLTFNESSTDSPSFWLGTKLYWRGHLKPTTSRLHSP